MANVTKEEVPQKTFKKTYLVAFFSYNSITNTT